VAADPDRPHDQLAILEVEAGERDALLDARALADRDEVERGQMPGLEVDVAPDPRPEESEDEREERRAREVVERQRADHRLGEPPAEVVGAPERVAPRPNAAEHEP